MKLPESGPVLLSACLAGIACTYQAQPKTRDWALKLVAEGRAVPVCPEVAGGLGVPRPEAEIQDGDGSDVLDGRSHVVDATGRDVTESYLHGARLAAAAAQRSEVELAI